MGVNPHSNGLAFSRSKKDFILNLKLAKISNKPNTIEKKNNKKSLNKQRNHNSKKKINSF